MPTALGGKGGGVTTDEEHILWIKNRLENFPTLPDLTLPVSTSTGEEVVVEDVNKVTEKVSEKVSESITENSETVSESGTVN
jgi:hypothetical protein